MTQIDHFARTEFALDERKYDRFIQAVGLYRRWLRFRVSGLEHVPVDGPALLVGNHTGLRLHDAWATVSALRQEHPGRRIVRGLAHRGILDLPRVADLQLGWMGAVIGTPENARGLLDDGWLVLTYPEGAKSTARTFADRDTVLPAADWGLGWAKLAIESGAPVIPVGVCGVESAIPTLFRSRRLGKRFGMQDDLYPVAPQSPFIGFQPFLTPLFPLPVRCGLAFGEPIVDGDRPTDPAALRALAHDGVQRAIDTAKRR